MKFILRSVCGIVVSVKDFASLKFYLGKKEKEGMLPNIQRPKHLKATRDTFVVMHISKDPRTDYKDIHEL